MPNSEPAEGAREKITTSGQTENATNAMAETKALTSLTSGIRFRPHG